MIIYKLTGDDSLKKRQLMLLPLIFIIILTGCSNKEYDSAMDNGKDAIEKDEYKEAQSFFKQALKEKSDDQVAIIYLAQTQNTIAATKFFKDGDFEEAIQALNELQEHEDGSSTLQARANKQLIEIKDIKTTYDQLEKSLKKANNIGDNKEYEKALSVVEISLDRDFNHDSLNSVKKDLIKLQTELKTAQKEMDEHDKKQVFINQVTGYWSSSANDYELCHFTKDYYVCAIVGSEFYVYDRFTSWDINLDDEIITIYGENEPTITIQVPKSNTLMLGENKLTRLSKEEVINMIGTYQTPEEFFDINKFEEWDSNKRI